MGLTKAGYLSSRDAFEGVLCAEAWLSTGTKDHKQFEDEPQIDCGWSFLENGASQDKIGLAYQMKQATWLCWGGSIRRSTKDGRNEKGRRGQRLGCGSSMWLEQENDQ